MNSALIITALGPLVGGAGWLLEISWLFWIGVAICALTMFLDVASGAMKLPVLPVLFMGVSAFLISP